MSNFKGAGSLLLRVQELKTQKSILCKELKRHEMLLAELRCISGSINLGLTRTKRTTYIEEIASDVIRALSPSSFIRSKPQNCEMNDLFTRSTKIDGSLLRSASEGDAGVTYGSLHSSACYQHRLVPTLRIVVIVVLVVIRLRRMVGVSFLGSAVGNLKNGSNRSDRATFQNIRSKCQCSRSGSQNLVILKEDENTGGCEDPAAVSVEDMKILPSLSTNVRSVLTTRISSRNELALPAMDFLFTCPECEAFELLVKSLLSVPSYSTHKGPLSYFQASSSSPSLGSIPPGFSLLEVLAEGNIPHALRMAKRGVTPPRGVTRFEALQVVQSVRLLFKHSCFCFIAIHNLSIK